MITQKMDGNYGYWTGDDAIFTRGRGGVGGGRLLGGQGDHWEAFAASLPRGVALEGEVGHRNPKKAMRKLASWSKGNTVFWVFDAPEMLGSAEERRAYLEEASKSWDSRFVRLAPSHGRATSRAVLDETLAKVYASGGEG